MLTLLSTHDNGFSPSLITLNKIMMYLKAQIVKPRWRVLFPLKVKVMPPTSERFAQPITCHLPQYVCMCVCMDVFLKCLEGQVDFDSVDCVLPAAMTGAIHLFMPYAATSTAIEEALFWRQNAKNESTFIPY